MGPLHGGGVLVVEGAFVLVYHDAVLFQRLIAVAVKLLGEQAFSGAEGIGGIHDNQVVLVFLGADKLQSILIVNMHPLVIQAAGGLRQIFFAPLHHQFVDFHQVDVLDLMVPGQLPHHAAVAGADNQHPPGVGMNRHGHVDHHFVVNKLILFCQHHIAVQSEKPAELFGVEHVDALELALSGVKLPVYLNGKFHAGGMAFREPKLHGSLSSQSII